MTPHPVRPGRVVSAVSFAVAALCLAFHERPARSDEPASIVWRDNYGSALEDARTDNRLLWIQFTGPWCINCRRMDRATFVHPAVITQSREQFVPVKLRSDEHEALAQSLGLTSLPSTVIVRPNGEVIYPYYGKHPQGLIMYDREALARAAADPSRV